ncbi:type IV pilin protein [Wenzhouxiangella sp. AB-CW3]|uniref:type IV pilin protein n=1 Tax=Wenzhouxiangella sp. AB-CW3 TaxID=2771012 RepID=UPI00168ACFB4|nr:type IV pilin protein [Wenzhouxiangella sp. AB-CW3]QOC22806.1 type IV pilin protein [Wenzhouxiangella sp. AB-CW3]
MKVKGFTMIELLIAVVIVAVLAAIAIPMYQDHVDRTRRADAVTGLTELAQELERCFTRNNSYTGTGCPSGTESSPDGHYNIAITAGDDSFTLAATPTGVQDRDDCRELSLTHRGERDANPDMAECWRTE